MLAKAEYEALIHLIDRIGITPEHRCEYLPDQQSQLLVALAPELHSTEGYQELQSLGFRRSGNSLYRPCCPQCHACQSVRVEVGTFSASRRQKRILKRNADLEVVVRDSNQSEYYPLFERYIALRHSDGSMHPTTLEQYQSFLVCDWLEQRFFEFRKNDQLIAVAVTDQTEQMLSAVYTFFDPDQSQRSLGVFAILQQINHCLEHNIPYLYLGYHIDACRKMNYKKDFKPSQSYQHGKWQNDAT